MATGSLVSGAELSGAFYAEVVRPLLAGQPHSAALLGWGSDVLGYDTERSTDHGWGPRLLVFLEDQVDVDGLTRHLDDRLPARFRGWPVRYGWDEVAPTHHVTVTTLSPWLIGWLGIDASKNLSVQDWLLIPQQRLLGVVAGRVYADERGLLDRVRRSLAWYPDQVWRWLLACQWHRLAQEEAFVARTGEVDDELGSAVTAARLVRDMMRLGLLLARRYAPYQKWLGTAFARAPHDDELPAHLVAAVHARDAQRRGQALGNAWTALAHRHNSSGLTGPLDAAIGSYHGRPAQVLMADRFSAALLATVTDPVLRALPLIGAIDQAADSTDLLQRPQHYLRFAELYGTNPGSTVWVDLLSAS